MIPEGPPPGPRPCPSCRYPLAPEATKCPSCEREFTTEEIAAAAPPPVKAPRDARGGRITRADVRWGMAVLVLALALRLITIAVVHPSPRDGRFDDSVWYDTSARHLAAGDGYVFDPTVWVTATGERIYPGEEELTPTAIWPPGYPITLAGIYFVTDDSLWAGRIFNAIVGALTCLLVFAIARRLFGLLAGGFAGVGMALFPGHVLFTPLLMSETYFLFLMTATLALFLFGVLDRERPNLLIALAVGLLAGATAMVRGEFMPFPAIMVLLMLFRFGWQRSILPVVALSIGAAALFVPWTIRNERQLGEAIVGTTGAGRVALQGHHPDSEGIPSLEIYGKIEQDCVVDEGAETRLERELCTNREGLYRARTYAWDNKLDELRLVPRRMHGLFRSDESAITWTQSNKPWYGEENTKRLIRLCSFTFFGVMAIALCGWPLWWKTRDPARWLIFAPVPFYMLMFGVIFIGDPRYHFGMYSTLLILASPGMAAIWRATAEHWRDVMGGRSFRSLLRTFGTPDPRPAGGPPAVPPTA